MRKAILFAAVAIAVPAQADTVCEWMDFAWKIETRGVEAQQLVVRTGEYDRAQTQVALAMFALTGAVLTARLWRMTRKVTRPLADDSAP